MEEKARIKGMREIRRFEDRDEMAGAAAGFIGCALKEILDRKGAANLALAGGSSPARAYELLADEHGPDWRKAHVFFSDERMAPPTGSDSNYAMVLRTLLNGVAVPDGNVHPVDTSKKDAAEAAIDYENEIRKHFHAPWPKVPRFDLLLLGMGADGHTASLFPGSPLLRENKRLVAPVDGAAADPPVDRVTFTLPLINESDLTVFLVAGKDKLSVVDAVEAGAGMEYPAAMVASRKKSVWFTAP
jgi:6-phosphogluconolactonase